MYKLDNIYKSFDKEKTYVLNNLSLHINQGDFIAVTGVSGAGKTTLINILGAIDRPTKGNYSFNNINIEKLSDDQLAEFRNKEVGIIFQDYNLIQEFTVEQNILLPKIFSKNKNSQIDEIASRLNIDKLLTKKTKYLSGGEQQRVAFARAIINEPKLILADEPTGNLDEQNSNQLLSMLKEINEKGVTVVTVTHSNEFASKFNKILKLNNGSIEQIIMK